YPRLEPRSGESTRARIATEASGLLVVLGETAGWPTKQRVGWRYSSVLVLLQGSRRAARLACAYTRRVPGRSVPMRILIIEDEKKVAKALQEGLEAEGYSVGIAADGEEGFSLASREPFDLVLLDLALPRRDGIDVLASLRKHNNVLPVFILTARDAV